MSAKTSDTQAAILPTKSLVPDARNAKKHDEKQIAQIAASIREFGFAAPIVIDEDNNILAGHGRWEAAHKLDLENVPCRRVVGLTKAQKRAFIIADNKITTNAKWDDELLKLEIEELKGLGYEVGILGFDQWELDHLFDPTAAWNEEVDKLDGLGETDEEGASIIRIKCKAGDKQEVTTILKECLESSKFSGLASVC